MTTSRGRNMAVTIVRMACALLMTLAVDCAFGQATPPIQPPAFPGLGRFLQRDGEALYRAICQGCHMADAKGAKGAGTYPALAANPRLAAAAYPAQVVLKGKSGMPSFAYYLDDAQVAAVVNYVRTNFGNRYGDALSVEEVTNLRKR